MSQSTSKRRNPIRVAIAALGVALVAMAALIAFLVWGRPAPTMTPSPTPPVSATTSPSATESTPQVTTPTPSPEPPTTEPNPTTEPTASTSAPKASTSAPTASTSAPTASATKVSTPPPAPSGPQTMTWEGKAEFENFTVEVLRDDPGDDNPMIEGKAGLPVEVCLTGDVEGSGSARISSDPWTLEGPDGEVQKPQSDGYEPAFPSGDVYPVGECVRGFLTFNYLSDDTENANLVYENGLGDRAVWQFH